MIDRDEMDLAESLVASQRVYEGRIVNLRVDEVTLPNGTRARREVVEHPGAVAMVALTGDGRVVLVRQWRYAVGEALLEIPAGTLSPGEEPAECAQRELIEETGLAAEELLPVVTFWSAPGFTSERMHVFLARGLRPAVAECDEDETLQVVRVPWNEALTMCLDGRLRDSKSIAGLLATAQVLASSPRDAPA